MPSSGDFLTTVACIEAAFSERDITLFAKIDQADAASGAGAALRPTVLLLFGAPAVGTPIMEANPHAAVELPLKAVVWEDSAAQVHVDYLDVTKLLVDGYGTDPESVGKLAKIPALLSGALERLR
jgi:uncharacterized protein (DUF302 family)